MTNVVRVLDLEIFQSSSSSLVVVNLNSDDYSDREIDIFSANQIPAF
jgi:hypothetical protein